MKLVFILLLLCTLAQVVRLHIDTVLWMFNQCLEAKAKVLEADESHAHELDKADEVDESHAHELKAKAHLVNSISYFLQALDMNEPLYRHLQASMNIDSYLREVKELIVLISSPTSYLRYLILPERQLSFAQSNEYNIFEAKSFILFAEIVRYLGKLKTKPVLNSYETAILGALNVDEMKCLLIAVNQEIASK